tara:strand:+ start:277 stop:486 length:210 start_codon:yes stop_codon:yes gene_type:complete
MEDLNDYLHRMAQNIDLEDAEREEIEKYIIEISSKIQPLYRFLDELGKDETMRAAAIEKIGQIVRGEDV